MTQQPPLVRLALFPILLVVATLYACESGSLGIPAPCDRANPPAACGQTCSQTLACPGGFYCQDDACTADCLHDTDCSGGATCSDDGRCQTTDGGLTDGSTHDSGTFDASPDDGGSICADVSVEATPATPNVTLIIDRSGSMVEDFGDQSRWDALKDALIDSSTGLVANLETRVRFGLAMYTSMSEDNEDDGGDNEITSPSCPWFDVEQVVEGVTTESRIVDPDIRNYATIRDVYQPALAVLADEGFPYDGDTPTGESIDAITDRVMGQTMPDPNPNIFIVATDGLPDTCEDPDPRGAARNAAAQRNAVTAVQRAFGEDIRTYMIWVGDLEDEDIEDHIQDMANAGLGRRGSDPDAPFWIAGDDAGLRTALTTIVSTELSCEMDLNGELTLDKACTGTVRLNGRTLGCDAANGWRAIDETTIELLGTACDEFKNTPLSVLEATFPCDAVVII